MLVFNTTQTSPWVKVLYKWLYDDNVIDMRVRVRKESLCCETEHLIDYHVVVHFDNKAGKLMFKRLGG